MGSELVSVYISHSGAEVGFARALRRELEQHGHYVLSPELHTVESLYEVIRLADS
jgi:hypothetical protein